MDREFNIKPENEKNFTRRELDTLRSLERNERRYLRKACREVFHNNNSATTLMRLRAKYLGGFFAPLILLFTKNSHTSTCDIDILNSSGVCDDE